MLALFLLSSCATDTIKNKIDNSTEFKKICVEGSGKGRIELPTNKYTFSYESKMDRVGNKFDLVLDFPIVGEREVNISLDPQITNRAIKNSELTRYLDEQLGDNKDKARITKSIEEFFVFASDFMRFKAAGVYPQHYAATFSNDHFILERSTNSYRFVVDNYSPNQKFYERVVFKIFVKDLSSNAIMTLFLVPQSCDM
jgi:hypothetical protein